MKRMIQSIGVNAVILLTAGIFLVVAGAAGAGKTPSASGEAVHPPPAYEIGTGDVLEISVWKEPALTKQVVVLPDGSISFPLIGQLQVEGKTVEELKSEVSQRITRFVPNPNLSVAVQQVNSLYIYVIGKVNAPGRYELNTRVNVLQALAIAGGLNPFAKGSKIKIFREFSGKPLRFDFNYEEVAEGLRLEQNIRLQRDDVIVVP